MSTLNLAYRDDLEGARIRYQALVDRSREHDSELAAVANVHARRTGRAWAGATGIACAAALVPASVFAFMAERDYPTGGLSALLVGSWAAMGVAYALGRIRGRLALASAEKPSGDVFADLARLEAERPIQDARSRASSIELRSVRLPAIAIALLLPLTTHALVGLPAASWRFDQWIMLSLSIVGHAHVVLAWLAARFAKRAVTTTREDVVPARRKAMWAAYGWTILASAIPGAILLLIPPILTAITGLVVVPLVFWLAERWVVEDRADLTAA
jgi:hypothetical protein